MVISVPVSQVREVRWPKVGLRCSAGLSAEHHLRRRRDRPVLEHSGSAVMPSLIEEGRTVLNLKTNTSGAKSANLETPD